MRQSVYSILKARFLINEEAIKNWRLILFLITLAITMIANTHYYESKVYEIAALTNEAKDLRSQFVDNRSQLMKLRLESTVAQKMEERQVFTTPVAPQKIMVVVPAEKSWYQKLWQ
jgi:Tfp pilus assembly protein PilO